MNKNKKRNRIILCICSILVLFASVFAFIPLNKETKVVKADTIEDSYSFEGSFVPLLFTPEYTTDPNEIILTPATNTYDVRFSASIGYDGQVSVKFGHYTSNNLWSFVLDGGINFDQYFLYEYEGMYFYAVIDFLWSSNVNYYNGKISNFGRPVAWQITSTAFDLNVSNLLYQSLYYFDSDNNYIIFRLSSYLNGPVRQESRSSIYYFGDSVFDDNESYNQGFSAGRQTGYENGYTNGIDVGYSSGYNTGKNDGYNLGRNEAIESSGRYSFTSLISSVIDVPVKAFTSLFNFEILGVNLSGFFLGLLTCCIVIGVVRLIL